MFVKSIKCPLHLIFGNRDIGLQRGMEMQVAAEPIRKPCDVTVIRGNHFTSKTKAIEKSIELFKAYKPVKP